MQRLTVRVDAELAEQLERLAAEERESVSTIMRRYVRRGLQHDRPDTSSLARVREGDGRVR